MKQINFSNNIKNDYIKFKNYKNSTSIDIIGKIGKNIWGEGYDFEDFKEDIDKIEGDININIKSYGGDLFEALSIYDYIRSIHNKVTTKIIGTTASSGTVISLAGDVRLITQNSKYLIHKGSVVIDGNSDDFEEMLNELKELDDQLINLFVNRSNLNYDEVLNLMKEEKFINAEKALEYGFVDKIVEEKIIKKEKNNINNMDKKILDILNVSNETEALSKIKSLISNEVETEETEEVVETEETEEVVETEETEEMKNLRNQLKEKEEEIENLRAELNNIKDKKEIEEAENKVNEINNIVEKFINDGVIIKDSKESWINVGLDKGIEYLNEMLKGVKPVNNLKLSDIINNNKVSKANDKEMKNKWIKGEISGEIYAKYLKDK